MTNARAFWTSTLQDLSNDTKNTPMRGVLAPLSNPKHSGVLQDSKSPTLGVGISSSHLAQSVVATFSYLPTYFLPTPFPPTYPHSPSPFPPSCHLHCNATIASVFSLLALGSLVPLFVVFVLASCAFAPIAFHSSSWCSCYYCFLFSLLMLLMFLLLLFFALISGALIPIAFHFHSCLSYFVALHSHS
jgi:hypothetical protein